MLSKVFKAYDVRGLYPDALTEKVAWKIGYAAGTYLRGLLGGRGAVEPMLRHVVVGRDMRTSSPKLSKSLIEGLNASGTHVFDLGMVDTSFIYFAINHLDCGGGIMTTASHNPAQYNGFKISRRHAAPVGAATGLIDIQRLAATIDNNTATGSALSEERDLWDDYGNHVRRFLELKRSLKVVVDASNGMAGAFIPRIFGKVKNLEIKSLNLQMTGKFAHDPNPLVPENMVPTQKAVKRHKAHLGVCFDGDADRCMVCDEKGNLIGSDILGAVFAQHFLKRSPGSPIVYDLRSSKALPEAIEAAGGTPVRGRVGHVFLKQLMRENDAVFGAELSGHMYYRDNFYTDSGAITFATLLSVLSGTRKNLSSLVKPLAPYVQSGEQNFKVDDKKAVIRALKKVMRKHKAPLDDLDGVSADKWEDEGWWLNVRESNTEPMMRLNLEARTQTILKSMLAELEPVLGTPVRGH